MGLSTKEKFERTTTPALGIYANQIIAYLQDMNKALMKLDEIRKNVDIIFDAEKRANDLWGKKSEAEKMYNKIMIELERRCKKDISFSFDYPQISKITNEIDKVFEEHFGRNSQSGQRAMVQQQIQDAVSKANPSADLKIEK